MNEPTYSLTELGRLCGRSKSTLLAMIASGELEAAPCSTGRRSWTIRHSDAVDAGLRFRGGHSIDAAFRNHLQEQIDPLVKRLDRRDPKIDQQLGEILSRLERMAMPPAEKARGSVWRSLGHAVQVLLRLAGGRGRNRPRDRPLIRMARRTLRSRTSAESLAKLKRSC